jgi:peptidoglycan/xylan/chitin deacetylase (PgdA/CDA1 family)
MLRAGRDIPRMTPMPLEAEVSIIATEGAPLRAVRGSPRRTGALQRGLGWLAAGMHAACGPRETQAFGILMYHRTCEAPAGFPRPTWNVPPLRLAEQLAGLVLRGWRALPLLEVLNRHRQNLPIPRKTFVVTFDDGYENNLLYALPVLKKLQIPATIFLATAYLDSEAPFPSDDWPAAGEPRLPAETWRPLKTDQCRELVASGLIELAAHTHTHADFRGRPDDLIADLQTCQSVLRERFDIDNPTFAFPYGTKADGFSGEPLASAARNAGVQSSLTTEARLVRPGDDPFDWGRFAAEEHDTAATLAAKLGGWHTLLRSFARKVLRRSTGQ